jgi:hypothetical protein
MFVLHFLALRATKLCENHMKTALVKRPASSHESRLWLIAQSLPTTSWLFEYVQRQEGGDEPVGGINDFADAQIDGDAAQGICLMAGQVVVSGEVADHMANRVLCRHVEIWAVSRRDIIALLVGSLHR